MTTASPPGGVAVPAGAGGPALPGAPTPVLKKRRKVNNLTVSLGRMAHVKSKTLHWMKTFDKAVQGHAAVSVSFFITPSVKHDDNDGRVSSGREAALFHGDDAPAPATGETSGAVVSPWVNPYCDALPFVTRTHPFLFTCSFCDGVTSSQPRHVSLSFNGMLPRPHVFTCALCARKTCAKEQKV
jgi:hypothetical protein